MIIATDDTNAFSDVNSGAYEKHYQLKPGDKVLDIGAHVGAFTEVAAKKVGPTGRVVAVEPHPRNFGELQKRCSNLPNVILLNYAAWNQPGMVELWNNPGNSGGHSLFKCGQHDEAFSVMAFDVINFAKTPNPDFIKMDCEGAELSILTRLMPAMLKPVHIAFEAHDENLYRQCKALLESFGYNVTPTTTCVGVCYAEKA